MNTSPTPKASDALQKARNLGTKRLCATKGEWFACDDRLEPVSDRGSEILYSHGQTGFESAIADGDIVEYSTIANEETDEIIEEVKKDDAEYIVALHNAFPSIHAELERVTAELNKKREEGDMVDTYLEQAYLEKISALTKQNVEVTTERDVALKGYRGMREAIENVLHDEKYCHCSGSDQEADFEPCLFCYFTKVLTSFPEIK